MIEITPYNLDLLKEWDCKAVNSPIRRWLSTSTSLRFFSDDMLGWARNIYISNDQKTVLNCALERGDKMIITAGLWSLHTHKFAKALAAGKAIKTLEKYIKQVNAKAVDMCAHETNLESRKLAEHVFGKPWGICPKEYWDCELGEYVDGYHYRKIIT